MSVRVTDRADPGRRENAAPADLGAGTDRDAGTDRAAGVDRGPGTDGNTGADRSVGVDRGSVDTDRGSVDTDQNAGTDVGGRGRRDAAASRQAIVRAARRAFARQPYAAITVKMIAAEAGVSPALIIKYFGSKEQLFAQIADFGAEVDVLLDAPLPELGRRMVATMLDTAMTGSLPLVRVAFALQHGDLTELVRTNFRVQVVERLRARLDGPDADLRAELAVGHLLGLGLLSKIVRTDAIRAVDPARIVDLYGASVQRLLDGPDTDGPDTDDPRGATI